MTTTTTTYETLTEAIAKVGNDHPGRGFYFQDMQGKETFLSFVQLERVTSASAAALREQGVQRGDRIVLMLAPPREFVLSFLAAVRLGAVPVPLAPPSPLGGIGAHREYVSKVVAACGATLLIVSSNLSAVFDGLSVAAAPPCRVLVYAEPAPASENAGSLAVSPDDPVFLQYTSGSTSDPRGVVVTHRALTHNIRAALGEGLEMDAERDFAVSWLPLHHDMGLIGFVLGPIYWGVSVALLPTLRFVADPSVWFDTLHRHGATVSFAPNFAYALTTRRVKPTRGVWDLSRVRVLGCGAEPISAATLRAFCTAFAGPFRLDPDVITPAYGLAEATLAVAMKRVGAPTETRRVDEIHFQLTGEARLAASDTGVQEHVACGRPFEGHQIEIIDEVGQACPECMQGQICLAGPSVMSGYFNAAEESAEAVDGGWLRTGDLGYLCRGQLFVTGRIKDLIIVNGRNIHPQIIEWVVGDVPGVRKGSVVAFSTPDATGEKVVLLVETALEDRERVAADVHRAVASHALPRLEVLCLSAGSLPKTTSGKLRRQRARQNYLSDRLFRKTGRHPRA
jgi:fatty-acyl-CoA synthase